jgi:hypothetical protein
VYVCVSVRMDGKVHHRMLLLLGDDNDEMFALTPCMCVHYYNKKKSERKHQVSERTHERALELIDYID